ncbi:transcriptional regulator GcvA [Vineibacter terrae]|uniref:Transcriptional regulator GcvA n=1 Tax=Vineibacter terrae TaxID=2586908 RepID=A0A5C8PI63_9HYPH|nr:transcriptional regulator GcvA [Vineibacter terrae]TXL73039.1 transcriptional regulator GcvA [Vineibacter terrae]HEX2892147.1 transcriptional regulator GcvA [Vineibacter terrae]
MRISLSRLPPLNALRAFVVAAKHMSFSRAAGELHVTPAAISQQIKQLEDQLGCELFRRSNRNLVLTDEGQACLPGLAEAFERIVHALEQIDAAGQAGPITVSVAPSFAAKWLVPRLDNFRTVHPEIDVRISASMHLVDFDVEDVDCAIRYGAGDYGDLFAERILEETVFPVCSPALAQNGGALKKPRDLAQLTLLHDDSPDQDPSCPDWRMWLKAAGVTDVEAARGLRFNQSSLVLEAAVAGQGVALAKGTLAAEDLRTGRLIRPFNVTQTLDFAYYLVCPRRKTSLAKVVAFLRWLRAQTGNDATLVDASLTSSSL